MPVSSQIILGISLAIELYCLIILWADNSITREIPTPKDKNVRLNACVTPCGMVKLINDSE